MGISLSISKVTIGFMMLHLVLAALIPVIDDEAYYALWARYPSPAYYDHPPMIAYMIRAGTLAFGETGFGIRVVPVLAMALATFLVAETAMQLGLDRKQACLAALLFNILPLVMTVGAFATPDAPSALFWIAGLWASIKAVKSGVMRWWGLAGLILGLGILSKFTNGFLAIGLLGWLLATGQGRRFLRTGKPYVAVAAAVLPLTPYLIWNAGHDWLGFERQLARLSQDDLRLRFVGEYLTLIALSPTPLVFWFANKGVKHPLGGLGTLLCWSVGPMLGFFLWHATHAQVQANWLTPLQGVIAVLAVAGLDRHQGRVRATWLSASIMTFAIMAVAFNPWLPIGRGDHPANQTRGWRLTKAELSAALDAQDAVWIATADYALTGMLSYQFPDVPVWSMTERQRYFFQGDFPPTLCAAPGVFVQSLDRQPEPADALFAIVGPSSIVRRGQAGIKLDAYLLQPVTGPLEVRFCPS